MSNHQTILLILVTYFAIGTMAVAFIDAAFEPDWRGGFIRVLAAATWPILVLVTIGHVAGVWIRNRRER